MKFLKTSSWYEMLVSVYLGSAQENSDSNQPKRQNHWPDIMASSRHKWPYKIFYSVDLWPLRQDKTDDLGPGKGVARHR